MRTMFSQLKGTQETLGILWPGTMARNSPPKIETMIDRQIHVLRIIREVGGITDVITPILMVSIAQTYEAGTAKMLSGFVLMVTTL